MPQFLLPCYFIYVHVFNEEITGTNYNHLSRMYNGRKQQEYNEFLMDIRNRDAPLKENIDAEDLHIFQ